MILAWLLLLTGLTISAVAIYYSVVGLAAIFSAAVIPIIVMGSALEVAKLVCASWLKANWARAPRLMKIYMTIAVIVLMVITSMGIFGFLSKAHSDQSLVSGDVMAKIAVYDEKIKTAKENIDANRKALKQMDEAVDQVMGRSQDEKGADKAVALRRGQAKERTRLLSEITAEQKNITQLSEARAPIAAEVRKVEAEVGPLKYIAAFVYGETDETVLEKAVTWVIITIIIVFDPLAVIMLLAAQMTFGWKKEEEYTPDPYVADVGEKPTAEEIAEGDSPVRTETVINDSETTVTHTGFIAQEVSTVVPEAVTTLTADQVTWPFPTYEADDGPLTDEQVEQIKQSTALFVDNGEHPNDNYGYEEQTHTEEVPGETQPTALGGDITASEEKQEEAVEDIPLEQWNKMIAEAEAEALKEREARKYQILPELQKELGKQGPEFPANPTEGQEFTRSDMNPPRTFVYNGSQWVDIETYDRIKPNLTEVIEPETDAKKKTYMTKDQAGKIQIKNRS